MSNQKYANIMMIGRTGTGKSSFLNYLLQTDIFKTGKGRPITQGFETLEFDDVNGIPIRVYDSKGLEVIDLQKIKNDIINYIKLKCNDSDPLQWLHSIFYCVSLKRARFEETEITFIKEVCSSIAQTVHIVITHCDAPDSENVREMEQYIRSKLNRPNIRIIKVNSVETVKRNGTHIAAFGREEALNGIFRFLWSDMSERIANQYADEVSCWIEQMYENFFSVLDSMADKATTWNYIKAYINDNAIEDDMNSIIEFYTTMTNAELQLLIIKYRDILMPLAQFYDSFSNGIGYNAPSIYLDNLEPTGISEFSDAFKELDFDKITKDSYLGTRIREIVENTNVISASVQKGTLFLRIHKHVEDIIDTLKTELYKKKLSKEEIARKMYQQLVDALQD